jgi:hypothetical protein
MIAWQAEAKHRRGPAGEGDRAVRRAQSPSSIFQKAIPPAC